jgi:Flp pilus assembly protein TadD
MWAVASIIGTAVAFLPVLRNGFVNWDDPTVILQNSALDSPHVIAWAFGTTLIQHYQPLAWIAWSWTKEAFGLSAEAFHAVSLAWHMFNAFLIYVVVLRLSAIAGMNARQQQIAGVVSSLLFAVHPMRVEAVAWVSAFPYVLCLAPLLVSVLAYVKYACARSRTAGWLCLSLTAYTVSLLARANAIALPFALLLVDVYPLRRARKRHLSSLMLEKLPFAAMAAVAAVVEWRSRETATLEEVGLGARIASAAAAPFLYVWRTVAPVRLSPLDPLAISPTVHPLPLALAVIGLALVTLVAWRARQRWPALGVAWVAYLLMLAPVAGLTPSGVQATADRYMYLPGVIVSMIVGVVIARVWPSSRLRAAAAFASVAIVGILGWLTWRQTEWWHDSITLWTRAAELDPSNDIATYNLAVAYGETGQEDAAIEHYQQTLRLVPDHEAARRNLTIIQAAQAERLADRLAESGRFEAAANEYARALSLDPNRVHSRAARGMILMRRGDLAEAATELRAAFERGAQDTEVPNALAYALMQTSRSREAVDVLERALATHPDDINLAHNLARLLATAPDPQARDAAKAVRIATRVRDRTGGRDPRVLDTLAAAYAANGQVVLARETSSEAAARARQLGDTEMAAEITARARSYRR